jgi:hypothetical protein
MHRCIVTAQIGHFASHNERFIRRRHVESLEGHPSSKRIRFLPEVRVFMAFKTPDYCSDAGLHRRGNNWAF